MGEWSNVSVQSESESNVLVLMAALMFYYNQLSIQVLECILMFFSTLAEQYSIHTAQTEVYRIHMQCIIDVLL